MNLYRVGLFLITSFFAVSCFADEVDHSKNFLVFADIHVDVNKNTPMTINPKSHRLGHDLDVDTYNRLLSKIQEGMKTGFVPRPQFMIVLGDLVAHQLFSAHKTIEDESYVFQDLKNRFPDIPIFYVYGNNDSLIEDYGAFFNKKRDNFKSPYDVSTKKAGWVDGFLSTGEICLPVKPIYPCLIGENKIEGYYEAYLAPKLKLIALNSVTFAARRLDVTEYDAASELYALQHMLLEAEKKQEKVLLAMHIPPGKNVHDNQPFWQEENEAWFLQILSRYHATVVGILGAHTHSEQLTIIENRAKKIIGGIFYTAALSTLHGNAPSFKTFFYDEKSGDLMDYEAFYFKDNLGMPVLTALYDFNQYYCAGKMLNLSECLRNVNATKMARYFSAGNPNYPGMMNYPESIIISHDE